jgi:hypothetical protein
MSSQDSVLPFEVSRRPVISLDSARPIASARACVIEQQGAEISSLRAEIGRLRQELVTSYHLNATLSVDLFAVRTSLRNLLGAAMGLAGENSELRRRGGDKA